MYNPKDIEPKWQKFWDENLTFKTENPQTDADYLRPKHYILDMFPYPSGAGLHVGHPKGYVPSDTIARYKRAKGFNVLHTMGWDAFGLPAENYAIKTGTHPRATTENNVNTFRTQLKRIGFSYDWTREVNTTDPKYFQWTQWIFLKLFEAGLAYEQDLPINYCTSCKTGLANEEVHSDNTCDRCGSLVERRKIRQWVLAITKYADRLLSDIDELDWPEGIKEQQRNWIGKSEGTQFDLIKSDDTSKKISVYTTRIDTVFGMTYAVIAPDFNGVEDFIHESQRDRCEIYIDASRAKSDLDRTGLAKEKTGVFTGSYVINPFTGDEIPVYIGDYVLGNYGTGAVMAVPAHDERDFEFAKQYGLPIRFVVMPEGILSEEQVALFRKGIIRNTDDLEWDNQYGEDGTVVASGEFSNLKSQDARAKMAEWIEENKIGVKKINYKLRDWLFSRQRYWGEPIPLVHLDIEDLKKLPHISDISESIDKNLAYILKRDPRVSEVECLDRCGCDGKIRVLVLNGMEYSKIYEGINSKIICDNALPLELPEIQNYEPAGDGNSPLINVTDWINVRLATNLTGKRESNTMPQWAGSCWYYLRFMDTTNTEALVDKKIIGYWKQVDEYVGGVEHAVLHLLYARFWHKFLFDIGVVPTNEPFSKLRNQ
jgi:leucyl-tRNA synthetase